MTQPSVKRPTIREVAALAGVSRGTVSRVLNGGRWVSEEAESAVRDAITSTGYKPNPHARSLATNKSNSVAFLLTEPTDTLFDDPVFSVLVRGAAQALARRGQSLVVLVAGTAAEQARAADYITSGHVDGVLLAYSSHSGSQLVTELVGAGVPIVAFGPPVGASRSLGSVASDDFNGARRMVEHLRDRGRSRIAFISGPDNTPGGVGRLAGYQAVLGDEFDANLVDRGDWSPRSGAAAMQRLLGRTPDLDAVFAANDQMAAGALSVLTAAGYRVPTDVAVAGFDDTNIASTSSPGLTTMRQPFDQICAEGVRLLLDLVAGGVPATITLPAELVVRQST
ncbi:LacI family DNA-binding transcriptional regulator [Leifsonia sp. NPDC058230]|uniref:LacI family DNA-binding transcriptional regulator n=1 Tax=Leifsonia sp. NPDC058230 TaxID=3346391 RepID=UPI0036DC4135